MEDNDELKLSKEVEARLISVMEEGERVCQTSLFISNVFLCLKYNND